MADEKVVRPRRRMPGKKKKPYKIALFLRINMKLIRLYPTGFAKLPDLNWNEICSAIAFFGQCKNLYYWMIGDFLSYAHKKYGVATHFAGHRLHLTKDTMLRMRWWADTVPHPARIYSLHPEIQRYVFSMDDKHTAAEILEKVETEGWGIEKIIEMRNQFPPEVPPPAIYNNRFHLRNDS